MADGPIIERINQLAHEEEQLWQRASDGGGLTTDDQQTAQGARCRARPVL